MLAFAEACLGIGLFISGAFLVIVSSILFFTELASLPFICALGTLGAAAGDGLREARRLLRRPLRRADLLGLAGPHRGRGAGHVFSFVFMCFNRLFKYFHIFFI